MPDFDPQPWFDTFPHETRAQMNTRPDGVAQVGDVIQSLATGRIGTVRTVRSDNGVRYAVSHSPSWERNLPPDEIRSTTSYRIIPTQGQEPSGALSPLELWLAGELASLKQQVRNLPDGGRDHLPIIATEVAQINHLLTLLKGGA